MSIGVFSTVDCNPVKRAVSLVHDCMMVANLKRGIHPEGFQEQKLTNEKTLHFKHDVLLKRVLCVMHVLFQLCNVLQIEPS